MLVTSHARVRLRARLGDTEANRLIARFEAATGEIGAVAIEVARFDPPKRLSDGSNGDMLVVIVRDGSVETVMLRRSWNQPFTAEALGVDRTQTFVVPSGTAGVV